MLITLLTCFALTSVFLTGCHMAVSYARYRMAVSRDDPLTMASGTATVHLIANIFGYAFIAVMTTAGVTFNSVNEQWVCHGAPYFSLLIVATTGGAIGGLALYFWEQFLYSRKTDVG